jgi:polyphosphate kinase
MEDRFINREISWLAFNERVLQEASDSSVPLLERLRFLGIFSNNLDEFFRVRVGSMNRLVSLSKSKNLNFDPKKVLKEIYERIQSQQEQFAEAYRLIKNELAENKIIFKDELNLNKIQEKFVRKYFKEDIQQFITPFILDNKKRFPALKDKCIYLAVKMLDKSGKNPKYALVEVPTEYISRFIVLPKEGDLNCVIMLDDALRLCLDDIFYIFEYASIEAHVIKLTRDAELDIDNDLSRSLIDNIASSLKQRKKGKPVRFICDKYISEDLLAYILKKNDIVKSNVIHSGRYHNFKDFMKFPDFGLEPKINPIPVAAFEDNSTIFKAIAKKDIFVQYPYHSFDYFIDFLREAAIDPKVESIKVTLYRLAKNSIVVNTLVNAVKNGKKVTVVLELKARFDEEANIEWARMMQDENVKIIYGAEDLKVHSKICQVKRVELKKEKYYTYISTGNFNEQTSELYSDVAIFTKNQEIAKEIEKVFTFLETGKNPNNYQYLIVSPFTTRKKFLELIQNEIYHSKAGRKSEIILKMNSLVDPEMIDKLYEANRAGVKVKLIIRGICCIKAQVPGESENIEAISVIDKYLEHGRIYYFSNGGKPKYFISSADMMQRNIDNRVEVTLPIFDATIKKKLLNILYTQLSDNVKSRIHDADLQNNYNAPFPSEIVRSQDALYSFYLAESSPRI